MAVHWILFIIFITSTTTSSNDARLITVTSGGTNNNSCLSGNTSCYTLDFAISGLNQSNTTIRVDYSHAFNSTVHIDSEARNVSIKGQNATDITITCSESGQGLVLSHLNNVAFHGIQWINCSIQHSSSVLITSPYDITGLYTLIYTYGNIKIYSGLVFYNVTDLSIEDCSFSTEGGVGLALFDVSGTVNITNSHFYNNTIKDIDKCDIPIGNYTNNPSPNMPPCSPLGGGLYIELTKCGFKDCLDNISRTGTGVNNTQYNIDGCIFESNNNSGAFNISGDPSFGQNNIFWPFGRGGGMGLNILGNNSNNTFSITNTVFQYNTAQFGGGMNLVISDNARNNMVQLSYVNFTSNKATEYGGGFRTHLKPENAPTIRLRNVLFHNNTAKAGGGGDFAIPAIDDSFYSSDEPTILFEDCEWYDNNATVAGAALQCLNSFVTISPAIVKIHFHNCLLVRNVITPLHIQAYTVRYGQGALYTLGVQVEFSGYTDISCSLGTALVISSTQIALQGTVVIHHNQGAQGSGMYLDGLSWILMMNGLNLTFYKNDAFEAGAAIYYVYDRSRAFNTTQTCFMKYENSSLSPHDWNVSVTFSENIAVSGGSAIFLTDPPDCHWQDGFLFLDYSIFSFKNNSTPHISTNAHNITFNTSSESVYLSEDGYNTIDVMPGSMISIPVVVVDYFNSNNTVATLDTKCFNFTLFKENYFYGDICADKDSEFIYIGSRVLTINVTLGGFQLGGPQNNSELMIVFKTLDAQPLLFGLRINFISCSSGYIYKNHTKFCECHDNSEDTVRCFLVTESSVTPYKKPCVRVGYWVGTVREDKQEEIAASCTSSNCRTDCATQCMNLVGWCAIPDDSSDFCVNHHDGPLCALCKPDYCFGYDGKLCLPCTDCNTKQTVILFLSIIAFWVVIIIGSLLLLQLNFQIGSGYMYGFVYYFSVLPYITTVNLQSTAFSTFVSLFQGIVHLNPEFLSYTPLCFKSNWNLTLVQVTFFDYIHPLIISIIIYLLLQVNRRCCRSAFTQSSPIHILCIILLLVHTSLFQTSIDLIEPINLGEHTYVKIQPDIPYRDLTKHLVYLLFALVVEVAVVLFAVGLFLAPCLMRCGILQKVSWLKHIIDEYQACYRRNHRWFAGYYLLCRQLVALTPILSNQSRVIFFQQILNSTILLVHVYIQPYKERWLNMLDTIFLFDLTLLTFLRLPHSVTTFDTEMMYAMQYFLIAIPCVYFLLVSVVILGLRVKICCDKYQKKKQQSTNERVCRRAPKAQPAQEYDELDGETLSVEMSDCTRQTLGMRNQNLISYAPPSGRNAAASPLRDASTDLDDVVLIPPTSFTPKWIKNVTSFLKNQVKYWRSRRSNTTEQQPFRTRSVTNSLDYSRSTRT